MMKEFEGETPVCSHVMSDGDSCPAKSLPLAKYCLARTFSLHVFVCVVCFDDGH